MIEKYINEKIIIVPIYCKVQIFPKTIQMINKFDEVFNHILHMSLLSHFNFI